MFLLLAVASATVLGIDLGESKIVVSVLTKSQPLKIAQNMFSKQETPAYFALWSRDRKVLGHPDGLDRIDWGCGALAYDACLRNPDVCVRGNHFDNATHGLLKGYEVTALALADLIDSIRQGENITDRIKVVIAVKPDITPAQKTMLYTACALVGVRVKAFVSSFDALATIYALEREISFTRWGRIVLFLDIGASGTSASLMHFQVVNGFPSFFERAVKTREGFGGDYVDERLLEYVSNQYNIDISDQKVRMSLLDSVRRSKEKLTVRTDDSFQFGDGPKITLTRSILEECAKEMNETIYNLVKETFDSQEGRIDGVELVGSASRMPFVKATVQLVTEGSKIQTSLNAETATAMGAGYIAATFSPTRSVRHVNKSLLVMQRCTAKVQGHELDLFLPGTHQNVLAVLSTVTAPDDEFLVTCDNYEIMKFKVDVDKPTRLNVSFITSNFLLPVIANITDAQGTHYRFKSLPIKGDVSADDYLDSNLTISQLLDLTKRVREFEAVRSAFEAYMISLEYFLKEEGLRSEEKKLLTDVIAMMKEFLAEMNHEEKTKDIEVKLAEISNQLAPVVARLTDMIERPELLDVIRELLQKAQAHMEECAFASEEALDDFDHFIDEMVTWFEGINDDVKTAEIRMKKNALLKRMAALKEESRKREERVKNKQNLDGEEADEEDVE